MRFKHLTYKQKMEKDRKRNPERKKKHIHELMGNRALIDWRPKINPSIFSLFFSPCFYLFDENPLLSLNLLFLCILFFNFFVIVVQEAVSFFSLNSISNNNNTKKNRDKKTIGPSVM